MDAAGVTAMQERARNVLGFLVLSNLTREDRVGGNSIQVTDNGNQTVTVGSLLWSRCAIGQSTDGCGGAASTYAYCNAQNNTCNGDMDQGKLTGSAVQPIRPASL